MFDPNTNRSNPVDPRTAGPNTGWGAPNTLGQGVRGVVGVDGVAVPREGFLTMSFVWMFLALLVSAGSAWFVMTNQAAFEKVGGSIFILFIVEIVLVVAISGLINRIGAVPALGLLFAYALINGLVLGVIVLLYVGTIGVPGVVSAFAGASAIFAGAAVYGVVTKRDLTSLGGILFMALIGLIVTSFVQFFFFPGSSVFSFIIGVVGVLIFTGLTAYDVQRIQKGQMPGIKSRESASVVGALALYLDFVNLFLLLLRVFGSGRN